MFVNVLIIKIIHQVQQFVEFTILSTWHTHVRDLSTHDILELFLPSLKKNFSVSDWETALYSGIVVFWLSGKICIVKIEKWIVFPESRILIRTLHLCQKYTIKRYCLKELQNYISCIIYMFIIFSGLSTSVFSTFYFGKLVFCLLVFIICFLFFMSF